LLGLAKTDTKLMKLYHIQEYLSEKAAPRVTLDDDGLSSKRLLFKIRTEPPDPDWFDEVAGKSLRHLCASVAKGP
jgi:hypothetical protein